MGFYFQKGQTVLFQGDSVTDCGRSRENDTYLGGGYPAKTAAAFQTLCGGGVNFINRGVSRNRTKDLLDRYDRDFKAVAPDFLSILIGINDTWRRYDSGDPTSTEQFAENYETLLKKIKQDLPNCRIMLIEPFVLNSLPDRASWRVDLDPKIQVVRDLARRYADFLLPMDGIFAAQRYSLAEMSPDGVHPSDLGHGILARAYLNALGVL